MAAELKLIKTVTTFNAFGNLIEIFTKYNPDELPNVIAAFFTNTVGVDNDVPHVENELLIQMNNYPSDIDFVINPNGELIVVAPDAAQYSVDSNGDLIYTTP